MIKNENIKLLIKKYNEKKLSHVFLIETNDKILALKDIIEFVKVINCNNEYKEDCDKCNLCHLIETNNLPSLKIIYPDGQAIKKIQMEELKRDFSSIPYLSNYNTYIINDAEKFNASSANTMLKFIEEPENNIIGFLITNNKENVINTIKSRCEIIKSFYEEEDNLKNIENIQNLAYEYLYKVEVEKQESIVYNKVVLDEKLENRDLIQMFKVILDVYLKLLNKNIINSKLEKLVNLDQKDVLKRILIVSEVIDKLNYNLNSNLILDYFVLRLEE